MIKDFKFFRSNETRINWQLTGLLDDATNVPLLIGVLDITYRYIQYNNLNLHYYNQYQPFYLVFQLNHYEIYI